MTMKIAVLEVYKGLGLALRLRPCPAQEPGSGQVAQTIFRFGLSPAAQITFKFRYGQVAQIISGSSFFQMLSNVTQNSLAF
jgi:hypothetical protein